MPRQLRSEAGDVCDSQFEVMVVDDLIGRGVPYEFHPGPFEYSRKVRGGFCKECDSNNVRKGTLYTPDLYLPSSDTYVELKGGSMTQASRGRLVDYVKNGEVPIRFLFRYNKPIYRGSKTKHLHWAERMGCVAAVGIRIPDSWLT